MRGLERPEEPQTQAELRSNPERIYEHRHDHGASTEAHVKGMLNQARDFWRDNDAFLLTFKSQGFDTKVMDLEGQPPQQLEAAIKIAKEQPHFLSTELKLADANDKGYFVIALAKVAAEDN